jgi:DNA mismatch endonuclease, patch repair protein
MSDVFTVDERSRIMSRIMSSNTSPEYMMAAILHSLDVDFESGSRELKGKPDFIIKSCMIAIFCDGDFWHGHSKIPDIKFWRDKMAIIGGETSG